MPSNPAPKKPWSNALDLSAHPPFIKKVGGNERAARHERKERLAAAIDVLIDSNRIRSRIGPIGDFEFEFARELRSARIELGLAIWRVACEYNAYVAVHSSAPRVSTIDKELKHIEETFLAAADAIDSLGDQTLDYWHCHDEPWRRLSEPEHVRLYDRALGIGFPPWAGWPYPDLDDPEEAAGFEGYGGALIFLAPRLRMSAELAALVRRRVRERLGPDRGGGQNLFAKEHGKPGWHLVRLCYGLVEEWTGEPTTTEGGYYDRFVLAVHEFATGESWEEARGLRDRIKDAVAILGERRRLQDKLHRNGWQLSEQESRRLHELNDALKDGRRP